MSLQSPRQGVASGPWTLVFPAKPTSLRRICGSPLESRLIVGHGLGRIRDPVSSENGSHGAREVSRWGPRPTACFEQTAVANNISVAGASNSCVMQLARSRGFFLTRSYLVGPKRIGNLPVPVGRRAAGAEYVSRSQSATGRPKSQGVCLRRLPDAGYPAALGASGER